MLLHIWKTQLYSEQGKWCSCRFQCPNNGNNDGEERWLALQHCRRIITHLHTTNSSRKTVHQISLRFPFIFSSIPSQNLWYRNIGAKFCSIGSTIGRQLPLQEFWIHSVFSCEINQCFWGFRIGCRFSM